MLHRLSDMSKERPIHLNDKDRKAAVDKALHA